MLIMTLGYERKNFYNVGINIILIYRNHRSNRNFL